MGPAATPNLAPVHQAPTPALALTNPKLALARWSRACMACGSACAPWPLAHAAWSACAEQTWCGR